jgi:thiamine-monophosphate kinase
VHWLRRQVGRPRGRLRVGIGDDAAVFEIGRGRQLALTADLSIEGVHFTRALHPARSVGHRALARSLSDIAAMGGIPRFAAVSLGIWRGTSRAWVEAFYAGLIALARRYEVELIGGDTAIVRGNTVVDVSVAGEVRPGRTLLRSGASPGDSLFVSGYLGLSALGLKLLKFRRGRLRESSIRKAIQAHLYPEPRCALGRFLAEKRIASALIDVSDGLSSDLSRICEASGVGARVRAHLLPFPNFSSRAVIRPTGPTRLASARSRANSALEFALHGGEDYELLFAVPARKVSDVPREFRGIGLRNIGEITRTREVLLIMPDGSETPLISAGYDHFRKNRK